MHFASHALWTVIGLSAYLGAVATAVGVIDAGLVFPRANTTYEPSDKFPIVFAIQNSKLAEHLEPSFSYRVLNQTNITPGPPIVFDDGQVLNTSDIEVLRDSHTKFNWTSASENDPYLLWDYIDIQGEGPIDIGWSMSWVLCNEIEGYMGISVNSSTQTNLNVVFSIDIEFKKGGEKADLVAATDSDSDDCPNEGVTIEVTDEIANATYWQLGSKHTATCAVLAMSSPTPTSNPCKVKINEATVESMQAEDLRKACEGPSQYRPAECPEEDHAVQMLAAAGVSSLAAILGTVLFLL